MKKKIIVGTRGSELALVQAEATEQALREKFPELEIERKIIKTTGDRRTDVALAEVAKAEGIFDKGVFIKELEIALAAGEIDVAVHSLKDVPTVLEDEFLIAGTLPREDVRDVLISRHAGGLEGLPQGAVVGTSSVRRAKMLQWLRNDVQVKDLRGNVPTRVKKVADGDTYDAILLAAAGLKRLGILEVEGLHFTTLPEGQFMPAAGQGAVGLEIRSDDARMQAIVSAISDDDTFVRASAEREFLRLVGGGCHTPIGVFSVLENGVLHMQTAVFPEQGGEPKRSQHSGNASDWKSIANELFLRLL